MEQPVRAYAIGDIHGHSDKLARAHALIAADRARVGDAGAPVVHTGDLCDRGPDTKGVVEYLCAGLKRGENWVVLRGNHDAMMSDFLDNGGSSAWLTAGGGGRTTLASYGVDVERGRDKKALRRDARERVPKAHRKFLRKLPLSFRYGELFFCHAGIRPGVPLALQTEQDLIWIRLPFLRSTEDHGPLIVHGHTPVPAVTHFGNRLDIDTGAGQGRALSAVVLEGRRAWVLTENGRAPVDHA